MRYSDPQLVESLAFEYVIGTMAWRTRRRFESLMKYRVDIRQRVEFWQQQFLLNAEQVDPLAPPADVWKSIESNINPIKNPSPANVRGWFWSALTTTAVLAVIAVGLGSGLLNNPGETVFAPDHIGFIGDQSQPLWVISANLQTGVLEARAVTAAARSLDSVYELWMLPSSGQPLSIGLLPVDGGHSEHQLPAGLLALLRDAQGLAVSIEPPGGSPTGLPTGEVIQTTKIWEL